MRNTLLLLVLVLCIQANAQHDAHSTFFWNKMSLFNPAASGVNYRYQGALIGREQWVGLNGSPYCVIAAYDMKLNPLHGGAGVNFLFDEIGASKSYGAKANYSYHIKFPGNKTLSMGASGGMIFERIDLSQLDDDPLFDPIEDKLNIYDFNFGLLFKSEHLDLGLSSSHQKVTEEWKSDTRCMSNYFAFGSYRFSVINHFDIQPTLLFRIHDLNFDMAELNSGLMITLFEKFWTGFTYSTDDFFSAMIGYDIANKFRVGYSFDYLTTFNAAINYYGNHEVILGVLIK